jgi:hypothetical protein
MRKLYPLFLMVSLTFTVINSHGQMVSWPLISDGVPVINEPSINAGNFSAGPGITFKGFGSTGATGYKWSSLEADSSKYFQVTVSPKAGYVLYINKIQFGEYRSLTGIHEYQVQFAMDSSFLQPVLLAKDTVPDNTLERNRTIDSLEIKAVPGDTLYFRWLGYKAESTAGTWRINDTTLKIFGLAQELHPNTTDSKIENPSVQIASGVISSVSDSIQLATAVFSFKVADAGSGDSQPTRIKEIMLKAGPKNTANWKTSFQGITVKTGSGTVRDSVIIDSTFVRLITTLDTITIADASEDEITVGVYLKNAGIRDGDMVQMVIDSTDHGCTAFASGSGFSSQFDARVISNPFIIDVHATRLLFTSVPQSVLQNSKFSLCLAATDRNNNVDSGATNKVSLSVEKGSGTISSAKLSDYLSSGSDCWTDIKYSAADSFQITAIVDGLGSLTTSVVGSTETIAFMNDDFENGDLEGWENISEWENSVESPIDGTNSLKHNGNGSSASRDTSYIYASLPVFDPTSDTVVWRFVLKNGNWDPSADNKFWFFLVSSQPELANAMNGYAVGVNMSGTTDMLSLWRVANGKPDETLIGTSYDWGQNNHQGIEVSHTPVGKWEIKIDTSGSFGQLVSYGNVVEEDYTAANYCGLVFIYTSTRAGQLWMDDVYIGPPVRDKTPPIVASLSFVTSTRLKLQFSEKLDSTRLTNPLNYLLNGTLNPDSIWVVQPDLTGCSLHFSSAFPDSIVNQFIVSNLTDTSGNTMVSDTLVFTWYRLKAVSAQVISAKQIDITFSGKPDSASATVVANYSLFGTHPVQATCDIKDPVVVHLFFNESFSEITSHTIAIENVKDVNGDTMQPAKFSFSYHEVKPFDVVINEIMANPDPSMGLPEAEYVELYNRTGYSLNLTGWTFVAGSTSKKFPVSTIGPNDYLILCEDSAVEKLILYGKALGLFTSSTTLSNSGTNLVLMDSTGTVISWINYTDQWYKDDYRALGGWSLEQTDPANPCAGISNWASSSDPSGGTPGAKNSIYASNPDVSAPELSRIAMLSDSVVQVFFTEPVDKSGLDTSLFTVDHGVGHPFKAGCYLQNSAVLSLSFKNNFKNETIYQLTVSDSITDCTGNLIGATKTGRFAVPSSADSLDIVVNEVLFNPLADGADFVELYNRSSKVIDLTKLLFCSRDEDTYKLKGFYQISDSGYLFFPSEYMLLTTDFSNIKQNYHVPDSALCIEMATMPSLNDDKGYVVITDKVLHVIDGFVYSEDMHYPLLTSNEGVSLERVNFDQATNNSDNWHSASETSGFATPGYVNSQYSNDENKTDGLIVEPEIFSPDNDGYNDLLNISYHLDQAGFTANMNIFDSRGRLVRQLVKNSLLGIEGVLSWNGVNDEGQIAPIGIYIIYIELFNLNGKVRKYKKTCVLARKL